MLQLLVSGLVVGSIYAVMTMSYNIIYRVSKVVNFAQGEIMTFGALVVYTVATLWHQPLYLAIPSGLLGGAALALVIDLLAVRSVWKFGGHRAENHNWVISTFGFAILLQTIYQLVWGAFDLKAPSVTGDHDYRVGSVGFSLNDVVIVVIAGGFFYGIHLLNERTTFGRASEAMAENPGTASIMGINTSAVLRWNWVLAGVAASAIGMLAAPSLVLGPRMGFPVAINAFAAMVMGGIGNPKGALVAGFAIGIFSSLLPLWVSGGYVNVLVLTALMLVLYLRPQGFFGRQEVVKV
jgi:branched-chain amino acid transport system permease protein